ncbi:hypothetical protein [Brucella sp. 2280]|uniref:hypothetical protein n=1 Tax=Brucella sp. 2280 TaxID=2592625 RepID=UPI001296062B|nr:hypothetical protein [Brucella sp. 2280]QGA55604.1 hypothetical protein GHC20_00315 [Brucella sp. 2280]
MQLKSILLALGIGAAGLTLSGCVSESYYGTSGGYYDPYYVRGGYVGSAIIYDSGRYRTPRRYHSYHHNHRPNRPDYNRPNRPDRPGRPDRPHVRPGDGSSSGSGNHRPRIHAPERGPR